MMSRRCIGADEVLDGVLAASQPARLSAAPSPAAPMATATMAVVHITAATDIRGRLTAMRLPIMAAMDRVTPMDRATVMAAITRVRAITAIAPIVHITVPVTATTGRTGPITARIGD